MNKVYRATRTFENGATATSIVQGQDAEAARALGYSLVELVPADRWAELEADYSALEADYSALEADYSALEADYSALMQKHNALHMNAHELRAECARLRKDAERWDAYRTSRSTKDEDMSAAQIEFLNATMGFVLGQEVLDASADALAAKGGGHETILDN